ncbi:hypothetical_protein (plasmid) [Leishmania braziliensis MHOM/BR/75/M2904]|uniref:Hypothetical_protein n=1 Tax=Leishmania braziliensis MHOM/BR/75/M2904 TaxID=420245 RepID=A0A3P3YXY7_LEIBR|nr:hypothetical_protein [Leishmania braziliensis MHOM/BR/75/M2904]
MSDDGSEAGVELPQMWQLIHPTYNHADSGEDDTDDEEVDMASNDTAHGGRPADYVKLKKSAPRLGQLIRFLNDMEEEDLQGMLLEKDPVTQQTLLQWATLNNHFMLVEYIVKRMKRAAFFDAESIEVVVYDRWAEMSLELPTAAEVAERQKQRENEKAKRLAERAMANGGGDIDEDEESEEEEAVEPMPEELVYDTLEDYHSEWGDGGVGVVKRIGELGVYVGRACRTEQSRASVRRSSPPVTATRASTKRTSATAAASTGGPRVARFTAASGSATCATATAEWCTRTAPATLGGGCTASAAARVAMSTPTAAATMGLG